MTVLAGFYNIRPGNGAGLFFQPGGPHAVATAGSEFFNVHNLQTRIHLYYKKNYS